MATKAWYAILAVEDEMRLVSQLRGQSMCHIRGFKTQPIWLLRFEDWLETWSFCVQLCMKHGWLLYSLPSWELVEKHGTYIFGLTYQSPVWQEGMKLFWHTISIFFFDKEHIGMSSGWYSKRKSMVQITQLAKFHLVSGHGTVHVCLTPTAQNVGRMLEKREHMFYLDSKVFMHYFKMVSSGA